MKTKKEVRAKISAALKAHWRKRKAVKKAPGRAEKVAAKAKPTFSKNRKVASQASV